MEAQTGGLAGIPPGTGRNCALVCHALTIAVSKKTQCSIGQSRRRRPMNFLKPYTSQLLGVLRIMSGLLLLQHGTAKYLNFPAGPMNNASPATMSGAAGLIELIGGVLIIIGLFTRPVAFILSGLCAVAYFWAHAPRGFFPILNGGGLAALYSFVFLYLAAAGAGAFSLDKSRGDA
jgi:putative oxidoreductase